MTWTTDYPTEPGVYWVRNILWDADPRVTTCNLTNPAPIATTYTLFIFQPRKIYMPKLEHTKIYRGGITSPYETYETDQCTTKADQEDGALYIRFEIDSKGGGITVVRLKIGKDDFRAIFEDIAREIPESLGVFLDCASIAHRKNLEIAHKKNLESLAKTQKAHDENIELAEEFALAEEI